MARLLLLVGISAAFDSGGTVSSWDNWNEWSECDRTCGHGLKVRTRDCLGGHPGSAGCQGASYEKRQCSESICRECIRSQWAFQLKNSTELISTEIIRTQLKVDQPNSHEIFTLCTMFEPAGTVLKGTLAQYNNPDRLEPSLMIAGRSDYLLKRQKLDVITGNQIKSLEMTNPLSPGWICVEADNGNIKVNYNEENWEFFSENAEILSGGILTAGLGISGNMTNTFLISQNLIGGYTNVADVDLCFEKSAVLASLSPENIVSKSGEPHYNKQWGDWNDWGECSSSCDGGMRFRKRSCIGGNPNDVGCEGLFHQSEECMTQKCPVGWRNWSEWSECSNSCSKGVQIRIRECKGGSEMCKNGDTTETRSCEPLNVDQKGCVYSNWHFPKEVSISNYIMVKPLLKNMTESTFCYWMTSQHDGVNGTVFSYSHGEQWTGNSFAVMGSTSPDLGLSFFIFRKNEKLVIPNNFSPFGQRVLQCIILGRNNLNQAEIRFYVDGNHLSSSVLQTEDEFMIEDKGELIIGQDQDCLLGCFDEPQALTGDLEDFTIWDTALSSDEIAQMYNDGYPSIELEPKITLATDNCEKHGRIHFVSVWGEWNDWSKCSATCQTGKRTRSRNCYGDDSCLGEDTEIKQCEQETICEAIITECSQSKWNFEVGSSARFKSTFNSVNATACAIVKMSDSSSGNNGNIFALEKKKKPIFSFDQSLIHEYITYKNNSDFAFNSDSIRVCIAMEYGLDSIPTFDYYIESDLIQTDSSQGEWQRDGVTRSDYFVLGGGDFAGQIEDFAVWNHYFDGDRIQNEIFGPECHSNSLLGAYIELDPILNGAVNYVEGWSNWSEWTDCSKSCDGIGQRMRKRKCFSVDEETGRCDGEDKEVETCGPLICPSWSEWSNWSQCSESCDHGLSHRSRKCLNGDSCDGESSEMRDCIDDICPDPYDFPWECGTVTANTNRDTMRIVNGKTEAYGAVPYLCHLSSYGAHSCGTSIISPIWNIGAAHCVQDYDTPEQFRIICGSHHREKIDTYEQQRGVKQYIKHPGYDYLSESVDYDMMLFEVDQAWDFTDYVKPICLPKRGDYPDSGMLCKVSGWGSTKAKDLMDSSEYYSLPELAEYAQSVYVPITDMGICAAGYKSITRRQFCAGFIEGGKDACQGDSGGPLACPVGISGTYQLTGVVSHGIGCGMGGFPGVYTRVESLVDWILGYVSAQGPDSSAVCSSEQFVDLKTGGVNSPNFDGRTVYGYNLDCSWIIRIPEGRSNQKLILDFTFFHLEMSNDCERDFVAIYRGAKLNKLVGKYCGRQAPPAIIFSADEALRIEFHTDGEAGNDDPTGFALKFYKAPRKLIDSGCGSSAEQVAMNELEKLLVAHTRYEKCQWLIKPRLNGKTPSYPVIRLAQGVTPSCCSAVKISSNKKKFDSKSLVDSSALCRGEPVVGRQGQLNVQLIKGTRDIKGRMCKVQIGFYSVKDPSYPYLSSGEDQLDASTASQMADKSQYTCFMENISYPRYLGKSVKIEDDARLSSCRIEIRPDKEARSISDRPASMTSSSGALSDGPRRGQSNAGRGQPNGSGRGGSGQNNKNNNKKPKQPNRTQLLNRPNRPNYQPPRNNKRKQMADDFIQKLSKLDLEEVEEVDEEAEETERETEAEDLPEYEEENDLTREQQKIILRQQRYEARVTYRMKLREIRKEKKAEDREENREIRILERSKSRQIERESRLEQRNLLLSRTRRGANKKSKGGSNSKKDSKSQKPKKSKNSSKNSSKEPEAERISSRRPSKDNQPKKTGKPAKGSGGGKGGQPSNGQNNNNNNNAAGRISGKQKNNRPEDFKSCTATMITPKCILTTAACTGKSKNVNLFAKIGERQYGVDDDGVQTIYIKECIKHPKYRDGQISNDLQICHLSEPMRLSRNLMIPCMATNMTLNDGDIVVTESRTNFNRGKMEGSPFRTHIPITGKYKKAKEEEPILRAGYAFGDPLCMKEVGSPVFREDTHQRTLLGLVQGPIAPQNQCPTRLFNIVDLRDHQDWIVNACNMDTHKSEFNTSQQSISNKPQTSSRTSGSSKNNIFVPETAETKCPDNNIELWSFGGNCTEITVTSPNYPNWYPANTNCNYNINAPENTKVRVRFVEKFDIESHPRCLYDSLSISDPFESRPHKKEAVYCNGKDPVLKETSRGTQIIGSGNKLSLTFKSDESSQREGFKLLVDCVAPTFDPKKNN